MSMPYLDTVKTRDEKQVKCNNTTPTHNLNPRGYEASQSLNYETNDEEQIKHFNFKHNKLTKSNKKKSGSERDKLPPINSKSLMNLNSMRDSQKAKKGDTFG